MLDNKEITFPQYHEPVPTKDFNNLMEESFHFKMTENLAKTVVGATQVGMGQPDKTSHMWILQTT